MIRILHIFHEMANGGVEAFVMNNYRNIDRERVQFDFLTSVSTPGYFDDEIRAMGGKVFRAFPLKKNPIRNYYDISRIVKENHYQIVHRHTGSAFGYFDLRAARNGGAKNLILHSHNNEARTPILHKPCDLLLRTNCIKFACSKEAGVHLFGESADFRVFPNAIDCDKFRFSEAKRNRIRSSLGITADSVVIGHIGRFENQKNHRQLVDIFYELQTILPQSRLICIGEGTLLNGIEEYTEKLNISDKIFFMGNRDDVSSIINAFDVFCLPSIYEGFGITLVEAQANGLPCVTSKDVVPSAVNLTGNVDYISLEKSPEVWARRILEINRSRDLSANDRVRATGYDIKEAAKSLERFYLALEGEAK